MKREQFTWYRSYYEALKTLPARDFKQAVLAVCAYALDEEEPELTGVPNSVFTLIRPTLDSGRNKAENRRNKTGTNREQNENKPKTKQEQTDNKKEQNENKKEQTCKEGEREKENDSSLSVVSLTQFRAPTLDEVSEYNRLRGGLIDPKPFYDYYAAANWRDGEGKPVRNWQQKFIAWELRELDKRKGARNGPEHHDGGDTGKKWDVPGAVYL